MRQYTDFFSECGTVEGQEEEADCCHKSERCAGVPGVVTAVRLVW